MTTSLRSKRGSKSIFAHRNNAVRCELHKNGVGGHVRRTLIWAAGSTCCVALPTKTNAVRSITSNTVETGIWSTSAPNNPFGSFSTLLTGAVLPTKASNWHTTPGGTQPSHNIVSCSWFGRCLGRIGEIRCTAATQFYLLHRRSVSSINRAARLGKFHGKSRGGIRYLNCLRFTVSSCVQTGKVSRVVDFFIHVTDAAIGLRRASKLKEMWTKNTVLVL